MIELFIQSPHILTIKRKEEILISYYFIILDFETRINCSYYNG
jgi:hypothetical protein